MSLALAALAAPRRRGAGVGLFRCTPLDGILVGISLAQGGALALLVAAPPGSAVGRALCALALATALWWSANTVCHNHIHNPLFHARWLNRLFSLYLSLILAVPQGLWRARHLWHHAGEPPGGRRPLTAWGRLEVALVAALALGLLVLAPRLFLLTYLPGYLLGMGLCSLQGRGEHRRPLHDSPGVSIYGPLYNWLWLNDGYHAEHHLHPSEHWTRLPRRRLPRGGVDESGLPPVLRGPAQVARSAWNRLQAWLLVQLERLALAWAPLRGFMLRSHQRAFAALLPALPRAPEAVCIIGGGLFPRTLLVLARLLPRARFTVLDDSARSLRRAADYLAEHHPALLRRVHLLEGRYRPDDALPCDLLVIPLGLRGERRRLYQAPPAAPMFIHEWVFGRAGRGVVISWLLLKRLNLLLPGEPP